MTKITRRWGRQTSRRIGPALAAIGAAAVAGFAMLFLATPSAVLANIPAGSTIKVVVPTNGRCGLDNVTAHSMPTDAIVYDAPNFVITRVTDQTIPTDASVRFGMTVDTRESGCAMKQPITVKVNGESVETSEKNVSQLGSTMTTAFHPRTSKPTKTTAKPTKTTEKPTESPTPKPTKTTEKPTESPTPTVSPTSPGLPTTGARLGPLVTVGLGVVVAGGLLTAAMSVRRRRSATDR